MAAPCPSCNKFASLETEAQLDTDVEVVEGSNERELTVHASVRLVRNSSCCSVEMKECTLDIEEHVDVPECSHLDGHAWIIEDSYPEVEVTERVETTMRRGKQKGKPIKNPRYWSTYIGASLTVECTCTHCDRTVEVTLADETSAGSFDELT